VFVFPDCTFAWRRAARLKRPLVVSPRRTNSSRSVHQSVSCCWDSFDNKQHHQRPFPSIRPIPLIRLACHSGFLSICHQCHHHHHQSRIGRPYEGRPNSSERKAYLLYLTLTRPRLREFYVSVLASFASQPFKIGWWWRKKSIRVISDVVPFLPFARPSSPWANPPSGPFRDAVGGFSCMTEPHFSERSASLESHLRPKIGVLLSSSATPCEYGLGLSFAPSNSSPRTQRRPLLPSHYDCFFLSFFHFIMEAFAPKEQSCHNHCPQKNTPIHLFISVRVRGVGV
jgi:hypothetical protein